MKPERADEQLLQHIADAVLAVPAVLCLQPGLAGILRDSALSAVSAGRVRQGGTRAGVRFAQRGAPPRRTVDVHIVLRSGHRALDVTRDVRSAAEQALAMRGSALPVSVTVTGLM